MHRDKKIRILQNYYNMKISETRKLINMRKGTNKETLMKKCSI